MQQAGSAVSPGLIILQVKSAVHPVSSIPPYLHLHTASVHALKASVSGGGIEAKPHVSPGVSRVTAADGAPQRPPSVRNLTPSPFNLPMGLDVLAKAAAPLTSDERHERRRIAREQPGWPQAGIGCPSPIAGVIHTVDDTENEAALVIPHPGLMLWFVPVTPHCCRMSSQRGRQN